MFHPTEVGPTGLPSLSSPCFSAPVTAPKNISENHQSPQISLAAVRWASQVVMHQTRRMLFMAAGHVADNPFHAECLKVLGRLREASNHELPHQVLLKRMKMTARDFQELVQTLIERNDIEAVPIKTPGRTGMVYRPIGTGGRLG